AGDERPRDHLVTPFLEPANFFQPRLWLFQARIVSPELLLGSPTKLRVSWMTPVRSGRSLGQCCIARSSIGRRIHCIGARRTAVYRRSSASSPLREPCVHSRHHGLQS